MKKKTNKHKFDESDSGYSKNKCKDRCPWFWCSGLQGRDSCLSQRLHFSGCDSAKFQQFVTSSFFTVWHLLPLRVPAISFHRGSEALCTFASCAAVEDTAVTCSLFHAEITIGGEDTPFYYHRFNHTEHGRPTAHPVTCCWTGARGPLKTASDVWEQNHLRSTEESALWLHGQNSSAPPSRTSSPRSTTMS